MHRMCQHHHAALREHDIVVEVLAEPLPQLHRVFVEMRALVIEIVGADNRGVAPGIAATKPAFFDDRDIGNAMFLGQIISCTQTMPASADNDHIIFGLGFGIRPLWLPVLVAGQRIFNDRSCRKAGHVQTTSLTVHAPMRHTKNL
ncbi:hypothetical protein D9M70_594110 [compost metagenome]